jgi:formamidopyrimidine-DNA glycosylase
VPELPEVETVCRSLQGLIAGRKIARVEVFERRLRRRVSRELPLRLAGRKILGVFRRGKYILIALEGRRVWVSHLGMSGKLIHVDPSRIREKHDHIIVTLSDGRELRYHDPRRFGLSLVVRKGSMRSMAELKELGPEPFDPAFSPSYLHGVLRRSRRRIRDLLIDQSVVAGLGNIYANEVLFRAGIRPTTRGFRLGRRGARRIAELTPVVLEEAIRLRGTTFADYRDGEDRRGEFQPYLKVYDRDGKPCLICAREVKRVSWGNRSAFYCPRCQV